MLQVWAPSTGKCLYTFKNHKADVTGVTVHATGDYIVSSSLDKSWALYDLTTVRDRGGGIGMVWGQ